jgi:hypothetical protein
MMLSIMNSLLLAQAGFVGTVGFWAIVCIAVGGIIAILIIGAQYFRIVIPPLLIKIFWVLVGVVLLIAAVQFILWMVGAR